MGLLWIANSNDCVFDVLDVRMTSKYLTLFICTHKYWIEVSRLLQCQSHWLKKCFTKIWELFGCLLGVCFGYEALTLIPIVLSWLMKFPIPASFLSSVLSQKLRILVFVYQMLLDLIYQMGGFSWHHVIALEYFILDMLLIIPAFSRANVGGMHALLPKV